MDAEGVEPISDYSYAFSLHLDSLDISTDCSAFLADLAVELLAYLYTTLRW